MAHINGNVIFGSANLQLNAGVELELLNSTDSGLSSFEAVWTAPNGGQVTGRVASANLTFTAAEIANFDIPTDAHGAPLFRDLKVKYIGSSNASVSTGDFLIVRDLWYNSNQLECKCLHFGNSRPNTDGSVVVQCNLLERV